MDWITFLASETKSLAWPVVVITSVVILRRQISALVGELGKRITTAKAGGVELNFGEKIDEVEKVIPTAESIQLGLQEPLRSIEHISELSTLPPAYVISQAWLKVSEAIRDLLGNASIWGEGEVAKSSYPRMLLKAAVERGLLTVEDYELAKSLEVLRNEAVHSASLNISITDALRFDNIANNLIKQMKDRVTRGG